MSGMKNHARATRRADARAGAPPSMPPGAYNFMLFEDRRLAALAARNDPMPSARTGDDPCIDRPVCCVARLIARHLRELVATTR